LKVDILDVVEQMQTDIIKVKNNFELINRILKDNGENTILWQYEEHMVRLDCDFICSVREPVVNMLVRMKSKESKDAEEATKSDPMIQRLDKIIELLNQMQRENILHQ
jgi:hypothetical protein